MMNESHLLLILMYTVSTGMRVSDKKHNQLSPSPKIGENDGVTQTGNITVGDTVSCMKPDEGVYFV